MSSNFRVLIPEPIASLNKGEEAILRGIQAALSVLPSVEIVLYSPWPEQDRQRYGNGITIVEGVDLFDLRNKYEATPLNRSRFNSLLRWGQLALFALVGSFSKRLSHLIIRDRFIRAFRNADMIICGHNGFLGYQLFWFVFAAFMLKKKIAIYGAGVDRNNGPFRSLKARIMLRLACHNANFCAVRDRESLEFLVGNGVRRSSILLAPDPAVLMEACDEIAARRIIEQEMHVSPDHKHLLGVIPVRGGVVFNNSFAKEKDQSRRYDRRRSMWKDLLEFVVARTNAHVLFLPHCIGPTSENDDRAMSRDIYYSLNIDRERFTFIENEYSAAELKGVMRQCEFVLGERTHALIGAASMAVPCMALSVAEDGRMHGIIGSMFGCRVYNINSPDMTDLCESVLQQWENRATIATNLSDSSATVLKQARQVADVLCRMAAPSHFSTSRGVH